MKEQPRKGRFSNGSVKIDSLLEEYRPRGIGDWPPEMLSKKRIIDGKKYINK